MGHDGWDFCAEAMVQWLVGGISSLPAHAQVFFLPSAYPPPPLFALDSDANDEWDHSDVIADDYSYGPLASDEGTPTKSAPYASASEALTSYEEMNGEARVLFLPEVFPSPPRFSS